MKTKPRIRRKMKLNAYERWKLGLSYLHLMPPGFVGNSGKKRKQATIETDGKPNKKIEK